MQVFRIQVLHHKALVSYYKIHSLEHYLMHLQLFKNQYLRFSENGDFKYAFEQKKMFLFL